MKEHHTCPWWLCFTFDNQLRRIFQDPFKILGPYVHKGDYVLDLGPGMGFCTLPLAQMVGKDGVVYAADIQKQMLAAINRRASKRDIKNIRTVLMSETRLDLDVTFDFILLFWMLHEVPDKEDLFKTLSGKLKTSGQMLIVEPSIHVSTKSFTNELAVAEDSGFTVIDSPKTGLSKSALLRLK